MGLISGLYLVNGKGLIKQPNSIFPADQILLCEVRATMERVILKRLDGTFGAKRSLLRMD